MSRLHETEIPGKTPGTTEIVDYSKRKEIEPLSKHKIVMLGGTSGRGLALSNVLCQNGYEVQYLSQDGKLPEKDKTVHFFSFTESDPRLSLQKAYAINCDAPLTAARQLAKNGNLNEDSVIVTLSNKISDSVNPYFNFDIYQKGKEPLPPKFNWPQTYYPMAVSKEEAARGLFALSLDTFSQFVNFVANEIEPDEGVYREAAVMFQNLTAKDTEKIIIPTRRKVYIYGQL